ncbi:hypothetical protein [Bartonella sp. HY761]|uniref:hypothetical protein n=1 Tax=Bartonella sp. HY761 TaxID=2979330 RepID=UPI00220B5672|nr:hypothetical protein [Bartonella sp. HY761]UXN05539.1 hypothetical protein N6A79_09535 [Bartonella sp. HY761]
MVQRIIWVLLITMSYWLFKGYLYSEGVFGFSFGFLVFFIITNYAFMLLLYGNLGDILEKYLPEISIAKTTKFLIFIPLFLSISLAFILNYIGLIGGYSLAFCEMAWVFANIIIFYLLVAKRYPPVVNVTISRKSFEYFFLESYWDFISKDELHVVPLEEYFDQDQLISFMEDYFTIGGIAKADVAARIASFPWQDYFHKKSKKNSLYYRDIERYFVDYFFVQSVQNLEV